MFFMQLRGWQDKAGKDRLAVTKKWRVQRWCIPKILINSFGAGGGKLAGKGVPAGSYSYEPPALKIFKDREHFKAHGPFYIGAVGGISCGPFYLWPATFSSLNPVSASRPWLQKLFKNAGAMERWSIGRLKRLFHIAVKKRKGFHFQ